jgi:hypothetical protein
MNPYAPGRVSSRLGFDCDGRLVAEGSCAELRGLRWVVLGNLINSTVNGDQILFGWLGPSGRPPTPRERSMARPPYEANGAKQRRARLEEIPDEELDEAAALRACRLEQQRQPADLIHATAA